MHIAMHCGGMPFNGETIPAGQSLGGSESAAYFMARELAALGHRVFVFTSHRQGGRWDGVVYEWTGETSERYPLGERWHLTTQAPFDVVIVQRHPLAFRQPYTSKLNLWWLHDLALHRNAATIQPQLIHIDRILTVSNWHRHQVAGVYGIDPRHITATHNGVDYAPFDVIRENTDRGRRLVFASRPERGLEELVGEGGIMEQLDDCHLTVCGYDNTVPQMAAFYRYLWQRCEQLPNVTLAGALGKADLYRLLADSALYVYPTMFEDTSNIMLLEANAAGTPFVGMRNGAVPETGREAGVALVDPDADGRVNIDRFAREIRDALRPPRWRHLHKRALEKRQAWSDAALQWSELFDRLLHAKSRDGRIRLHRHLERMSDITALSEDCRGDVEAIEADVPGFKRNYGFFIGGDYAEHYRLYYEYERDRGVVYGPEDLAGNPRFECICDIVRTLAPRTVLDYGCAHGHYIMNLARRLPELAFVGVDINAENIDTAAKWAVDEDVTAAFVHGTHTDVQGQFELIIAAEVLEHVPDPAAVAASLMEHLAPGGTMLVSTPYGPWEAIGYDQHPGWRAHIHHFERQDLRDLFGNQENYRCIALPFRDGLGHFVCTFQASGEPVGEIDYARKLVTQAPAETLSLCMIVKDGEDTLGRCLAKVAGAVDEIVIGIDRATTDGTRAVAERFGAHIIETGPALATGFDAARNATVNAARMDWVLWLDDDELIEGAEHLRKYLRPNCYDGYALQQHHFAVQPAGLLQTDLPVRLFRNCGQIRFFGVVHEHPSQDDDMNAGVGKVIVLPDVAIGHNAYHTEAIRRRRFERNWPLILRDREQYPERRLGWMLYLRDLAHMIRYTLERSGRISTVRVGELAGEAIELWRKLLAAGDTRLTLAGLKYYSEAVRAATGGVEYTIACKAAVNGSAGAGRPVSGCFARNADIRDLTALLVGEQIDRFEEKYF